MYTKGYNIYKNNSINYASKEQLLLMLVDGAVKFSKRAEIAIEKNDVKMAHESLVRAQDIFIELMSTLNKGAGDWAIQLFKVYEFINNTLVKVNLKKDLKMLREILPLIEEIRDMWYAAYEKAKKIG